MRFEYFIAILLVIVIYLALVKIGIKKEIDFNKLVQLLGGTENIVATQSTLSRFIVKVKDPKLVDKGGIKKLGAQGIVELNHDFKIILGKNSKRLKNYIDDLK